MRRRRFLLGLATAAALMSVAWPWACSRKQLNLRLHPWIGYETWCLAQALGWLPSEVQLQEGQNASETMALLKAGQIDAGCLTLDEAIRLAADGVDLVVVAVLDESAGADVVLGRAEVRHATDLVGKRIAVERGAVGGLMLSNFLQAFGLAPAQVTVIDLPVDSHLAAWQAGEIDAAVTFAPYTFALERLGAKRLFDSRAIPGLIFDVLVVRRTCRFLCHTLLKKALAAHFRAVVHLRHSTEDALRRIAIWRSAEPEEIAATLAGIHIPDLAGNRYLLQPQGPLLRAAQRIEAYLWMHGYLRSRVDLDALFTLTYLPEEA